MFFRKIFTLASIALICVSESSFAAGFAIAEQSVAGLGNAFAGGAAIADDPSTVWYNPAGMTRLCNNRLALGTHWIIPKAKFHNDDSVKFNSTPLTGNDGGDAGENAVVSNVYFTSQYSDCLWFGLGINTPFGLKTKYDCSWVGRYHAILSELLTININPSIGYKYSDCLSVGAGFSVQYAHAFLTQAIDVGLLTAGSLPCDGYTELTGEDYALGFNLGVLYDFWCGSRLGLHYRSEVVQDLVGKVRFMGIPPVTDTLRTLVNAGARSKNHFPQSASASLYVPFCDCWAFLFDATWTKWHVLKQLRFTFKSDQADGIVPLNWENTWRISTGVNYYLGDSMILRGGFAYDETPIPGKKDATIRIPDADRYWFAFGGSYYPSNCLRLDLSYTYIYAEDPVIDMPVNTDPAEPNFARGFLKGHWDANAHIMSVQAVVEF